MDSLPWKRKKFEMMQADFLGITFQFIPPAHAGELHPLQANQA